MQQNKPNVFSGQKLSAEDFLLNYWQQKPHLFQDTCLPVDILPDRHQLFQLAEQEDVQSRIVYTEDNKHYQLLHDEPQAWDTLKHLKPTLLVSDIEKWWPSALALLDYFPFIKSWRFDDLMLSYAPTGASVGAHLDHYDVFLFQVRGTRRWQFDLQPVSDPKLVSDSDLAVLADYEPDEDHILHPGDILYLPPQHAHHGISTSDDCLTCSIGLRAPSHAELLMAVAEHMADQLSETARLQDQQKNLQADACLSTTEINLLRSLFTKVANASDEALAQAIGHYLSQYRSLDVMPPVETDGGKTRPTALWRISPFYTLVSYPLNSQQMQIFIDGEMTLCSEILGTVLSSQKPFSIDIPHLSQAEKDWLDMLIEEQILITADNE
ncbi:cupin domain-containing protein [Marinicella sp. W31]|uniref:cupin domain-containing protein n=1 Tax=Marinicella sp. W31 TaxID=3023713 RepID=UPI0037570131